VNTAVDPANCGLCGKKCVENEYCLNSNCIGVCGKLTKCGDFCVDTKADVNNCGLCGKKCPVGQACIASECKACDSVTTDCDGDGWLAAEGDCCDKAGLCGAEPAKVNPGAVEVVGNGIDDNCNGKTDLFDSQDTVSCDTGLASNSDLATDYAKALGLCRITTESPAKKDKTWGLIDAKLLRADGSAVVDKRVRSIRSKFGSVAPAPIEGSSFAVLSTGIAADATQTNPGPNGGAPNGSNVSTALSGDVGVSIQNCPLQHCIKDWFASENLPLKPAGGLPSSPGCDVADTATANDSVMLVLRLRAPTNAQAFSFNSYFFSAEYPEYVCSNFNDQLIALVDTPTGVPSPIPNPKDKNLMTYTSGNQQWPIGINVAKGTSLFSICEPPNVSKCWDADVSPASCSLGATQLAGTGFEGPSSNPHCTYGGGTYWLTTAGNVIPGQVVELRIAIWDVGDHVYDSLVILDGFKWLTNATLPGTGG